MDTGTTPILRVGLTGGIASGKSTVARHFGHLGALVLDADALAHDVLAPGRTAHTAVVERFGREVLGPDGRIDRGRLGQIVFSDAAGLAALNAIVHPEVRAELARRTEECRRTGRAWLVVYDAALLVETGEYRALDRLIVVRCARETQERRLAERGLSPAAARARLAAQAPLEDKLDVADHVVDTEVPLEETLAETERVYERLRQDYRARFGRAPE